MKKGTKVRILRDNTVGTIADSMFFKIAGQKEIRYEVRKPGEKEGRWYRQSEIGDVNQKVTVTIHDNESGKELYVTLNVRHCEGDIEVTVNGSPSNMKEHKEYHSKVAAYFISQLIS